MMFFTTSFKVESHFVSNIFTHFLEGMQKILKKTLEYKNILYF